MNNSNKIAELEEIHNSDLMVSLHDFNTFHDPNPQVLRNNSLKPKRIQALQDARKKKTQIESEIDFYKQLLETDLHLDEREQALTQLGRWERELRNNYQNIYRYEKLIADPNFKSFRRKREKKGQKVKKETQLKVVKIDEITDQMRNMKNLFIMGCFSAGKFKWAERVEFKKGVLHFYKGHEVGNFCDYLIITEKVYHF